MTLTSSVQDVSYDTDGATVDYPIPFNFLEDSDIVIDRIDANNNLVTLSLGTDYTVSGAGNLNGGTASMTSAIARGFTLHIYREVPVTQETQYQQNDPFPAKSTETAFDKLTMIAQQSASKIVNALRYPLSEFSRNGVLPPAGSRAQMLLGWDAGGAQEMVPRPASVGAGDLLIDTFVAGIDFTAGVSTTLTLSRAPLSEANCWSYFDSSEQFDFTLSGASITFTDGGSPPSPQPIPDGITVVRVRTGTTLSVGTPPQQSVNDSSIAPGSKLFNRIIGLADARDEGAIGNGVHDDSTALASVVPHMFVADSGLGDYLIATDTTIGANLTFVGGAITVAAGVTLTINGSIKAPSKVIFKGAGTVVVNRGIIDVAWFDGADASAKTAFCLRGVSNTNGTGKTLAYYPPAPTDAWATQSANSQWGYGWKVDAPIALEQTQNYTSYLTYSSFIATAAMDAIFTLGKAGLKADGQIFPLRLKTDGGNGLANWAVRIYGSSHSNFPHGEFYYSGGIAMTPNGAMQCSDISIGFIDTGELYNQAVLMDGTTGANNTITDIEIGFVNSTGFANGHAADSVVKIGSNCNGISVRKVSHRCAVSNFQDATTAVVLITNGGTLGPNVVSCRYGINIGPVLGTVNNGQTATAEAVVVADASSGAAAKMTGITIESGTQIDEGSPPGGSTISLNYTNGAIVQGMPMASSTNVDQKITVNSTCSDTQIYGVKPEQVGDSGVNTLINGHNYGAIVLVAAPGSGMAYVNSNRFPVMYQVQGGTITGATYTSGSSSLSLPFTSGAGAWMLRPGDNIAVSYTGSPSFNYVPM